MDQHLAKLAADYAAAVRDLSGDHFSRNGDRFRFTADGHTVEISFAGVDTGKEVGWRVIADGVVVKEEEIDEDDCTVGPSAFEEAWLILAKLIRPTETDGEAKDLLRKVRRENMVTDIETIRDRAQIALGSLRDKRPGKALAELKLVLEGIDSDSPDVEVIKRVIDRLEKVVCEIKGVEDLLNKTNFTFGNIKALLETPVEVPWGSDGVPWDDDPPRLN
jgi:hypothetical protein